MVKDENSEKHISVVQTGWIPPAGGILPTVSLWRRITKLYSSYKQRTWRLCILYVHSGWRWYLFCTFMMNMSWWGCVSREYWHPRDTACERSASIIKDADVKSDLTMTVKTASIHLDYVATRAKLNQNSVNRQQTQRGNRTNHIETSSSAHLTIALMNEFDEVHWFFGIGLWHSFTAGQDIAVLQPKFEVNIECSHSWLMALYEKLL